MKKSLFRVLCLAITVMFCGCQEDVKISEPSGKVVKIGFIGPITGANESWGQNSLLGVRVALQDQPLLLNGDRPEIIVANDIDDVEQAKNVVKKLVEDDGVSAFLIASGSNTVLGLQTIVDKYQIPSIALLATHPDVASGEYISQLPFDDIRQATVAALYVMDEMIVDRATVFVDPANVQSVFLSEIFVNKFTDAGGVVDVIEFPSDNAELEKVLMGCRDRGGEFF